MTIGIKNHQCFAIAILNGKLAFANGQNNIISGTFPRVDFAGHDLDNILALLIVVDNIFTTGINEFIYPGAAIKSIIAGAAINITATLAGTNDIIIPAVIAIAANFFKPMNTPPFIKII